MFDVLSFLRRPRDARRSRASLVAAEALECRTLLAGNVAASLNGGVLSLIGNDAANTVEVTVEGDDIVVRGLDGTTINRSEDDFVIQAGAMRFEGSIDANLGSGADTLLINGPLVIAGDVNVTDPRGTNQFAVTEARIRGDVLIESSESPDVVSLLTAEILGDLMLELGDGRAFTSLLDSTVNGLMSVHTGDRNDVILLDGSEVGGLHVETGSWRDDIIFRDSLIDGDFYADTGSEKDFVLIEGSTVTGDTELWLRGDSDLVVTQGDVHFMGDAFVGGILGKQDTIELSAGTTIGGEAEIVAFEHHSLPTLDGTNARIDRRLAEAFDFQVLLNGVELGELTLTVDTSSNTDAVESNNTVITRAETLTIEGATLPRATVSVTAGEGGVIDLGSVQADADGNYIIEIDLLAGPTTIMVTASDILDRMVTEEFNLHVAEGTVVRFESSQGTFDIELYDEDTPATVANFLNYFDRYVDSIVHRKATSANSGVNVIQGGGFFLDASDDLQEVVTDPPVMGEPLPQNSNVRGTIAMALTSDILGPDPDSGTSQWYINVADNTQLDADGFTVFGEVIGDGMDVVDAIFALPEFDINDVVPLMTTALGTVPLDGYELEQVPLTGTVSLDPGSNMVTGTGTMFTTELEIGDIVEIDGVQFEVIQVNSDTDIRLDSSHPDAPIVDADYFTEPIATTEPTREQYVVFNSIDTLL